MTTMDSTMGDPPLTVAAILRHGTHVHADSSVATATADGFREITYHRLGERVSQLAHGLRSLGVMPGQQVATFMWNNQEHLEAYFAVPSMGAVLHTLNIRHTAKQLAYMANQAEDQVVFVDAHLGQELACALDQMKTVHTVVVVGGAERTLTETNKNVVSYEELIHGQPIEFCWPDVDETSAAAMCYTSGTTGNPKGVVYSHRSTYLHTMAVCSTNGFAVGAGDRVLPIVPMFHANAWGLPYAAMMAGADIVLPDRYLQADRLIDMISTHRVTIAAAVPTIWNDVLDTLQTGGGDLSSLRVVPCGGSAVPLTLMKRFADRHGVMIRQAWGMTETSPLATVSWPTNVTSEKEYWALRATQGRPVCGVQARIVGDDGAVLPHDGHAVGELEVRGPWIIQSYYRGEDQSSFHEGWLRTGDVARIDTNGYITLTDRAKDVIKSGGEWISSVELEHHIMAHPDVREAAVIAVPDQRWQERPLAAIATRNNAEITAAELRRHLYGKVARWWVPERWTFIEAVPRTSVGKFDKKRIRASYARGAYEVVECRD